MNLNYYSDTDSLYITFSKNTSIKTKEVSDGVLLDYDQYGNIVGIDIDNASKKINMTEINLDKLPIHKEKIIA
jgi:uncharacterized protein YuzE